MDYFELFQEYFILRAFFISFAIACLAGILGVFILWQKAAYLSDSVSHAALLGVVVGFFFSINVYVGMLAILTVFFLMFLWLKRFSSHLNSTTILGILVNIFVAVAILLSSISKVRVDLLSLFIGDILSTKDEDLVLVWIMLFASSVITVFRWRQFLLSLSSAELASSEGINYRLNLQILDGMLIINIAIVLKIVGVLLIGALLLIPAASARLLARSPLSMLVCSILISIATSISGFLLAMLQDWPISPTIVICSFGAFFVIALFKSFRQ